MKMKLKDFPTEDLPREKLLKFGSKNLSNSELLAIILGSGTKNENVLEVSSRILSKYNLRKLSQTTLANLQKEKGIGFVNASKILSCIELGKRANAFVLDKSSKISCARDIANIFIPEMGSLESEHFKVVFLDSKNRIICSKTIFIGTLNESVVHPREIFKNAILENSANIILIHNHPSGDLTPSKEDLKTTRELVKCGEILGINVLDHIVIAENSFLSFLEEDLLN